MTIISGGPLSANDAVDIVIQVTDGLAAAHSHNIVHRDIKPANIMLTQGGLVRILDFGIAKTADNDLTRTGMGIGTLACMAPVQLNGKQIDARYRNAEHLLDDLIRARRNSAGNDAASPPEKALRSKKEDPADEWDGEFREGAINLLLPFSVAVSD